MAVTIGTNLGSYEITALLGKGGFGEVYRAKDKKLKREVAIKILPDEFSSNHDRLTRFQREAEVLATLNHPNIAAIHDLATHDKSQFLVLELVDGETLAERISRGPIPVEEALNIAKQIAEALEAAHEKSVIHRDLKPANIKITPDGKVKVLDFGLAKIRESTTSNLSNSPTLVTAATTGMLLGTAAYMSPEQAKGKEADRATDVWAFGCVLYEMLTGHQAFEGETVAEVLGGIFKSDPDWSHLPANIPAGLRRLLRRCLQKDANRRFKDAGDVRIEIEEASIEPPGAAAPNQKVKNGRVALIAFVLLAFALVVGIELGRRLLPSSTVSIVRFSIDRVANFLQTDYFPSMSPDGETVAFVQTGPDGRSAIWLRPIDSLNAHPLSGTENAERPFWSADRHYLGFFAEGKLKKVSALGGPVQTLCNAQLPALQLGTGTWNRNGIILFSTAGGLARVSENGGSVTPVTTLNVNQDEVAHAQPQFLPDGQHFLYMIASRNRTNDGRIVVGSLESSETRTVLPPSDIVGFSYAAPGYLFFNRADFVLYAQPFDLQHGQLSGNPQLIAEPVGCCLAVSDNGSVAYWEFVNPELAWFDRSGSRVDTLAETGPYGDPAISPDGKSVAVAKRDGTNVDIWIIDVQTKAQRRLTFGAGSHEGPIWSPDGRRIIYTSWRNQWQISVKNADGSATEELLRDSKTNRLLALTFQRRGYVYVDADSRAWKFFFSPFGQADTVALSWLTGSEQTDAGYLQVSPDEHWASYEFNESGRQEIYIQAFPDGGNKAQLTTNGGGGVRWRRDGKELFYLEGDRRLMAMDISAGSTVTHGIPHRLFTVDPIKAVGLLNWYDVSPDGQRFLFVVQPQNSPRTAIKVILNWQSTLKK
jgi:serine/threonine protein kinase